MKKILFFYLEYCPYCVNARKALEELAAEDSRFQAPDMVWIEESRDPETAYCYDYYYVPTFYVDEKKVYECKPGESYPEIKAHVRRVLELAAD